MNEAIIHKNTSPFLIESMGLNPIKLGAKIIDGEVCKPDAKEESEGRCMVCGRKTKMWICGAGSYLCARHQDSY